MFICYKRSEKSRSCIFLCFIYFYKFTTLILGTLRIVQFVYVGRPTFTSLVLLTRWYRLAKDVGISRSWLSNCCAFYRPENVDDIIRNEKWKMTIFLLFRLIFQLKFQLYVEMQFQFRVNFFLFFSFFSFFFLCEEM